MLFDLPIQQRLRDGGIVNLGVSVAAVADQVDHHVAAELVAILESHARRRARTASGSSAFTWKIGIGSRFAKSDENRDVCVARIRS